MKRNLILLLIFVVAELLLASCQKLDDSLYGELTTTEIPLESDFKSIFVYNNVNVLLKHSNNPRIELSCPSKLADKITCNITGDTLYIRNENDFNLNFSTNYTCEMTIYYDVLRSIDFASIGYLKCDPNDSIRGFIAPPSFTDTIISDSLLVDTIVDLDHFYLYISEGSGDIDLTFSCNLIKLFFINGTSKVTFRGKANYCEFYLRSYGQLDARYLNANFVRISNASSNDAYVWATRDQELSGLKAWIYSRGNIYYKGHPSITFEKHGEGNLIPLDGD